MASVEFQSITKAFGRHKAVADVSMRIAEGEFLAFLGPSGCGKTTLLRLLAGFEAPSTGKIAIGGDIVADEHNVLPPERRGIGMVFQSYALWPHMTVADNVGFALRLRKLPRQERERRVGEALDLVGLAAMARRKPHQLSGGQRQRVALARCLAMRPRVVLLDEPLANLDAHLRETMQQEFKRLHRETGATFVYVTHDQSEAMALADRIAVMSNGSIQQLAPPRELYREPATDMVARFIGAGVVVPVNVLAGGLDKVEAVLFGAKYTLRGAATEGQRRNASLRAGDLALVALETGGIAATVCDLSYKGSLTTITVSPDDDPTMQLRIDHAGEPPALGDRIAFAVRDGWLLPDTMP